MNYANFKDYNKHKNWYKTATLSSLHRFINIQCIHVNVYYNEILEPLNNIE